MVFLSICTALYDYTPQSENELALQEGELVFVLEKSDEDDWWKAKKKAPSEDEEEPTGLIPNNYVEESQPTAQAKALYDYSRQTDEELSFSEDATLAVYDISDPEWTLVGMDGEYGFAPANYIELTGNAESRSPTSPVAPQRSAAKEEEPTSPSHARAASGPAAAIAGIMGGRQKPPPVDSPPPTLTLPPRPQQFTPEGSDEEAAAPSLPQRPASQQMSPPPTKTQYAAPASPMSPTVMDSPPHNRVVSRTHDEERQGRPNAGGYHLYNISEMVSAMGKSKKMPTTLGLNIATGQVMIAPEKSRDGPQQEWSAEKLTHYSIEGKHVFMELVKPSKSVDFHAGAKDTAHEIVRALGEIAGAARAEGLREVLEAANGAGGGQKKGQVLYDFMAQGDDEVTVAVGDEVIVVDDSKSDDWWMVRRLKNGKEGVVPSSYVEITGVTAPPASRSGANAGKSTVEQNRLEEEMMTKEAMRQSKAEYEVGPGINLPARGSSLTNDGNNASQRSKKESRSHGRSASNSKTKPDAAKTRTWTDRSGAFKVEAQFIGLKDGKIHLHKLNGVKIAVPVTKMAIEDLEYVERATGVSLDDDKPLSDIKRRSTQTAKDSARKGQVSGRAGATIDQSKQKPEGSGYDWFDFFLKAGVSPYQCERYAFNFDKDSMDENILSDITPNVLRTLGLKEGDILRVMKYLDNKFGRTGVNSPDGASGGLFSGAGGTLKNNTAKGRPAPPVQTSDVVNSDAFKPKTEAERKRQDSNASSIPPPPPEKDVKPGGFEDDAWSVKPSKQQPQAQAAKPAQAPQQQPAVSAPPQPAPSQNLLDLSSLQAPLEPQRAQPQAPIQPHPTQSQQPQNQQIQQPQQQSQSMQPQPTGANPAFFSQLGQPQQQNMPQPQTQAFTSQQNFQQQPQQTGPPRQRPIAPQPTGQQSTIMPPPPARPMSAPQNPQQSNFGPPPIQPQLTGFQPQSHFGQSQQNIAAPGQSLNDLNQQRLFNQQQQFNQQQPLPPQQTGYIQQSQGFNQYPNSIQPQQTGFGQQFGPSQQPAFQNPYVIGQQTGSPFADPRGPKPSFPQMQPQQTGFQPLQPQPTGYQPQFQPALQPQQTGVNTMLPPALQPQNTGVNGFGRPGFGQAPPPMPPMPPMPQQQAAAAPLMPQKTGPAPPVRFGTPANKLTPQPTGRKANLSNATASNPFGF